MTLLSDLEKAIKAQPGQTLPLLVAGDYCEEQGDDARAAEFRARAASLKAKQRRKRAAEIVFTYAKRFSPTERGRRWAVNTETNWYPGYAEPGYNDCERVYLANWNTLDKYDRDTNTHVEIDDTPGLVGNMLEKLGFECEWEDEWSSCGQCGKVVRTQPDSFGWTPYYNELALGAGEFICLDCESDECEKCGTKLAAERDGPHTNIICPHCSTHCDKCNGELDKGCNGELRCPDCDGPCPCCSDE